MRQSIQTLERTNEMDHQLRRYLALLKTRGSHGPGFVLFIRRISIRMHSITRDELKSIVCCFHSSGAGKSYYPGLDEHISEEAGGIGVGGVGVGGGVGGGGFGDGPNMSMGSPARSSPQSQGSEVTERFSRKVFVGGLPPDIDEGKCAIHKTFFSVFFLCVRGSTFGTID